MTMPGMPSEGRRMRVLGHGTVHTLAVDNLKPSQFFDGYCEQGYGKSICGTTASRWVAPSGESEECSKCASATHRTVYFVQSESGSIKIGGTSSSPASRLAQHQTGSAETLTLLGSYPGPEWEERDVHRRFRPNRIRGEWYRSTPELLQFIIERCEGL